MAGGENDVDVGEVPQVLEAFRAGSLDEAVQVVVRIDLGERLHDRVVDPLDDEARVQLRRMIEAHRGDHLGERVDRVLVELVHPGRLVGHDERPLQPLVLGGDADGAPVGVTALRLDASDGEHEPAGGVAPVGAERHRPGHRRRGHQFAAGTDLDPVADAGADERVLHEHQTLDQRRAERIGELQRCRTGAALAAVDDDEVGVGVGGDHRLDHRHELDRVADADLETDRLAARQLAQLGDEPHHLPRRRERLVVGGGEDVLADRHEAGLGDLLGDLGAGQDAAVARASRPATP